MFVLIISLSDADAATRRCLLQIRFSAPPPFFVHMFHSLSFVSPN